MGLGGDGEGRDGVGLKSLNPSLPHHLCGAGKIRAWRSGEGQGKIVIPSPETPVRSCNPQSYDPDPGDIDNTGFGLF